MGWVLFKSVFLQFRSVPRTWFIPQREQAVLAIIGVVFWTATLQQALTTSAAGASVFSLFGLGLLYLFFSIMNLLGALHSTIAQYNTGQRDESHTRSLLQLFAVLTGMFVFNVAILIIYVFKGTSFTVVDSISVAIDGVILAGLVAIYGFSSVLKHPIARGWLAIAGKTVPQLVTAVLFLLHPQTAYGLALITLLGIDALSSLRFVPTLKAYLRDIHNRHLHGLLLGEAGNTLSGFVLTAGWLVAHIK